MSVRPIRKLGSIVPARKIKPLWSSFSTRNRTLEMFWNGVLERGVENLAQWSWHRPEHTWGKVLRCVCRIQPCWHIPFQLGSKPGKTRIWEGNTTGVKPQWHNGAGGTYTVGSQDAGLTETVASTLLWAETEHSLGVLKMVPKGFDVSGYFSFFF